jgi:hypothetical protein
VGQPEVRLDRLGAFNEQLDGRILGEGFSLWQTAQIWKA